MFLSLMVITSPSVTPAQELYALGGMLQDLNNGKKSYSWQLEYIESVGENLGLGVTYLNEGHVPNHHRDGTALTFWTRTRLLDRRLSLAAGIGPYYFYDTLPANTDKGFMNDHGWGALFSTAATWHMDSRWLFQLRANWVKNFDTFDSFSGLAGIGYEFEEPSVASTLKKSDLADVEKTDNEIVLYSGQTIVNSLKSQQSEALSVEFHRRLYPFVDVSAAWLYEGDSRLTRRHGLAGELWLVRDFLDDRLSLGIGGGAYFPIDHRNNINKTKFSRNVCGLLSLTTSYQILPPWDVRVSWKRVITDYNNDTDVILGGIGYRF